MNRFQVSVSSKANFTKLAASLFPMHLMCINIKNWKSSTVYFLIYGDESCQIINLLSGNKDMWPRE